MSVVRRIRLDPDRFLGDSSKMAQKITGYLSRESNAMKRASFGLASLLLIAGVGAASAQTMSYAEAISQIATVCKNDIARFCKGVPLGPRLRACFDANAARMSPQCQQTTGVVYASITRRATAQRDIGDICSADILTLCGTSFADANLVTCMAGLAPQAMSPRCYQTFVDTGWATEKARP
jgi:hypothetical protein